MDVSAIASSGYHAGRTTWDQLHGGVAASSSNSAPSLDFEDSRRSSGSMATGFLLDAGAEDDEHPDYHVGPRGPPVQRALCKLVDESAQAGLRKHFADVDALPDVHRLDDLSNPATCHGWLWSLAPQHGPIIENEREFTEAVRVRLGCGGPPDCAICGCCGRAQLDAAGSHASWCSLGEATAGHNAVRDVLFEFASSADPATEWEPEDLIPSRPRARPADVLTPAAIPGRVAALDVGVTSSAVSDVEDATEAMFARKVSEREPFRSELEAQNIVYRPCVWTCFGRPHSAAVSMTLSIARKIARRRGCSVKSIWRSMLNAIGVCLARRLARMSLACWPKPLHCDPASAAATALGNHWEFDVLQ